MAAIVDRALCMQRHPFSESSLVVHVLTAEHGRVHLVARGAHRMTSRYFAVLDLFDELELEWESSPRHELQNLRAGSVRVRRRLVRTNLDRFRAAVSLLELADIAARHSAPDARLFTLASQGLDALERDEEAAEETLVRFQLAFLDLLGLAPALASCAACGREAPPVALRPEPRAAFSAGAGGRLCRACAEEARAAGRRVGTMPEKVLEDGRTLADPQARIKPALTAARVERVRDFVGRFLDYHLEVRPKSQRAFLAAPNRNAPASVGSEQDSH